MNHQTSKKRKMDFELNEEQKRRKLDWVIPNNPQKKLKLNYEKINLIKGNLFYNLIFKFLHLK